MQRFEARAPKALLCALFLAAHCSAEHSPSAEPSSPPVPGYIRLRFTLNGAPGCENCASVGHVGPVVSVDGLDVNEHVGINWVDGKMVMACMTGPCTISGVSPGQHTLAVDLYACSGRYGDEMAHAETLVDVIPNTLAEAALELHLPVVSGSATVYWIVNGGANCTQGTLVSVRAYGPSCPSSQAVTCTDGRMTFMNLLPGIYDFSFEVEDPSVTPLPASFGPQLDFPDSTLSDVVIGAEAVEAGPVDLFCSSCPGEKP